MLWLMAAAVAVCAGRTAAAGPDAAKLVVVIYPDESDGAPGVILVNRAIRSAFDAEAPGRIEIRNEYVDTSRSRDADFMHAQVSLLRKKYAGRKVDLVIAGLSSGLDFALEHRRDLFPDAPIVFVAVDEREVKARRLPPDVIGVPIRMDLGRTLDLALRLHPDTRRVYVVAGSAPFDTEWAAEARQTFRPHEDRLEFVYLTGLPMDELLGRVANLSDNSLIYYLHIHQDGAGKPFYPAEALELLAAKANVPVYGHVDTYVGRGAVGGHVFQFETAGTNAARLALSILGGERPESVPVPAADQNTDMFDWRQLRRWGIDERSLPPGSIVRFKEPTFWNTYRWHVLAVATVVVLQTLLIAGLLIQRAKRRRAEVAARDSEARFERMADAAPVLIWTSGADKGGTYFNRPWLEFTGRTPQQELGEGWTEGVHPEDRARCLGECAAHFDAREPFEMVFRLRRHDGEYRWVMDRGIPRHTPDGEFAGYIGACTDITARRQAEEGLQASQQELRLLTGRLLAAQEAERRRIARELHDDLSQGLALLSVELDVIARRPPPSTAELVEQLRAVSARVRELSSAVHDLSHQLHPSKLEHLGLEAAVRGLCNEVGHHHRLKVTYAATHVPRAIPEATAVCLYRIVQEALRNVVKHGRTHHARVELTGTPRGLRLEVSDDGIGFDPAARGEGLGLVSMRERLSLVGGRILIDSRPGEGTRIDVSVPVRVPDGPAGEPTADRPDDAELVAAGSDTGEEP